MVSEAMLPCAAVREVEQRLTAAGCPDADFDARELFRLATGRDVRLSDCPPRRQSVIACCHVLIFAFYILYIIYPAYIKSQTYFSASVNREERSFFRRADGTINKNRKIYDLPDTVAAN